MSTEAKPKKESKHKCTKGKLLSFVKLSGGGTAKEVQCSECGKISLI